MKLPVLWPEFISGSFSLGIEINRIKTTVVSAEMPCYYRKHVYIIKVIIHSLL
jgi:hypothetical protein